MIQILGHNYMEALTKWVDIESIPDWLGGKSKGTLVDDVGPWSDPSIIEGLGLDIDELRAGHRPPSMLLPRAPSVRMSEQAALSSHNSLYAGGSIGPFF